VISAGWHPQARHETPSGQAYEVIAPLRRDRFAVSSYPYLQGVAAAAALPQDWFTRAAARQGERVVIAETGWLSTPLVAELGESCNRAFEFDVAASAAFLKRVLGDAARLDVELVTWWSDRDLLPSREMSRCPCDDPDLWCAVRDVFRAAGGTDPAAQFFGELAFKAFGSMGLREYDGTPKSALFDAWQRARGQPLARERAP